MTTTVQRVLDLRARLAGAERREQEHEVGTDARATATTAVGDERRPYNTAWNLLSPGQKIRLWAWVVVIDVTTFFSGVALFFFLVGHTQTMRTFLAADRASAVVGLLWAVAGPLLLVGVTWAQHISLAAVRFNEHMTGRMMECNNLLASLHLPLGGNLTFQALDNVTNMTTLETLNISAFYFSKEDITDHGGLVAMVSTGLDYQYIIFGGVFAFFYGKQIFDLLTQVTVANMVPFPRLHYYWLPKGLDNIVIAWIGLSPLLDGTHGLPNVMPTLATYPLAKPWLALSHVCFGLMVAWVSITNSKARTWVFMALRIMLVVQNVCKNAYDLMRRMLSMN